MYCRITKYGNLDISNYGPPELKVSYFIMLKTTLKALINKIDLFGIEMKHIG